MAYIVSKHTKRASCVIVGVHLGRINKEEMKKLLENADILLKDFLAHLGYPNITL